MTNKEIADCLALIPLAAAFGIWRRRRWFARMRHLIAEVREGTPPGPERGREVGRMRGMLLMAYLVAGGTWAAFGAVGAGLLAVGMLLTER